MLLPPNRPKLRRSTIPTSRILESLTLLAPDIIEAILAGRQASTLQLDDLLKPLPAEWERQRSELLRQ